MGSVLLSQPPATLAAWFLGLPLVLFLVYTVSSEITRYRARIPNLAGPRGLPIVGSLPWLRHKVHAEQYRLWSKKYGPVFQVQLGERTAVVINGAEAARTLFINQREATKSRPVMYVLHGKVQGGSPITSIGTSPWNESCKHRRKAGATAMNRVAVESYTGTINLESRCFLLDVLQASLKSADHTVDFRDAVRKYVMNLVLTLNYGTRVADLKDLRGNPIFAEMIFIESEINRLRNPAFNMENYIPILRPWNNMLAKVGLGDEAYVKEIGHRRVAYHKQLLDNLRAQVAEGTDRACIQGNVLKDPDSKHLSDGELLSVSLSMMAGADSTQPTVAWALLVLAMKPDVQRKALEAIVKTDPGLLESAEITAKVDYVDAFIKEVGRCYTPIKLGLSRATSDEVGAEWQGAYIPPKTLLFLNSFACSKDPDMFPEPESFIPERWMASAESGAPHLHQFAFGMGSRMCIANHLAHKAMYTAFVHLIAHFEILPAAGVAEQPHVLDPVEGLLYPESFVSTPRVSTVRLVPRDVARTRRVLGVV